MIKNYIKTALRYLTRQKGYTLLNIIGLTIGISSSLIIILYLFNELSYDKQHDKADQIFRISSDFKETDDAFRWASTQNPLGPKLQEVFAEVEQFVRLSGVGRIQIEHDHLKYFEEKVYYVDSTVFDVFTFDFVQGDPNTALDAPNSIVINESIAQKIFKGENPIGQSVKIDDDELFQVTGVYKDMPSQSHLIVDMMISASSVRERMNRGNWGSFNLFTYVLLSPSTDPIKFEKKLDEVIQAHVVPIFAQYNIIIKYELLNIQDIHLHSTFLGEPEPLGDITYIYIFSAVCIFLLVIACINYMNLATARSMKRATEVGIRKVMGAGRERLIMQFLTESMIITLTAFVLSIIIALIAIPIINGALTINLDISVLYQPKILGLLVFMLVLTGIFGGSYPAFYLSGFLPAAVLKGVKSGKSNTMIRKTLVVIQFSISIFMLVGTGIIYNQMDYVSKKDLGFDKDQVISFNLVDQNQRDQWRVLRTKLLSNPNIKNASSSSSKPGNGFGKNLMAVEMEDGSTEEKGINLYQIDYDYFPTLDIDIVEGRNISSKFPTDTATAILVNEAMVARFNWSDPIGKRFNFTGDSVRIFKVIGVAKDFHQQSLYNPIQAIMFMPNLNNGQILVKIDKNLKNSIEHIKTSWAETFPNTPLDYTFLDEQFQEQYNTDQLRGNLFLGFSIMTIIISCMGLLGLASFTAEQRTKEISVRKVLGASTGGLIQLMIKEFIYLVFIGAVPAFVGAWYFGSAWLSNFEYNSGISIALFIGVLILTLVITILSTGYFALMAASSNPADNLKHE